MRNQITFCLAIGLIAFCLCAGNVMAVNAQQFSSVAPVAAESGGFQDSPCARFPKASVFNSFTKALRSPEKVRCLSPVLAGDDLNMKRLPAGIGSLVNLEVLNFNCLEQLAALPDEIGNLSKLQELIIDNGNGCSMSVAIPDSIGKLQNLRVLRLYGAIESTEGRKVTLPAALADLHKLEVLDLGRNGLEAVPQSIAALSNLKTLRLEYNALHSVPDFVGNFKFLKELSLDANEHITTLPASLSKANGLKISMGNNALKLKDQQSLRKQFPKIVFSFENEYDDERANEEAPKTRDKSRARGRQ